MLPLGYYCYKYPTDIPRIPARNQPPLLKAPPPCLSPLLPSAPYPHNISPSHYLAMLYNRTEAPPPPSMPRDPLPLHPPRRPRPGDQLAARVKAWEAATTDLAVPPDCPFVVRLDGVAFRTYTSGLVKPFDQR